MYKKSFENRFNIQLNTYVLNGIVQTCGHRYYEDCECDGRKFAGLKVREAYKKKGLKIEDHG